jgi:hypothetical protein
MLYLQILIMQTAMKSNQNHSLFYGLWLACFQRREAHHVLVIQQQTCWLESLTSPVKTSQTLSAMGRPKISFSGDFFAMVHFGLIAGVAGE